MFYLKSTCPLCGTGMRGFRLCNDARTVVVMCDECDATWIDAREVELSSMVHPDPPAFQVPGLSCSIMGSRWASRSEIEGAGWGGLIAGEGVGLDGG
jgi:hypothetical protein